MDLTEYIKTMTNEQIIDYFRESCQQMIMTAYNAMRTTGIDIEKEVGIITLIEHEILERMNKNA